jgi:hypothetical protein
MSEPLIMWTVYDRPDDFPNVVVARMWRISPGRTESTEDIIVGPTLQAVRAALLRKSPGLVCMPRSSSDGPSIVETWL